MKQAHIPILRAFDEFKFNLGKKTLVEFIKGNPNPTIEKNKLDELNAYGCLYELDIREIESIIDDLIKNKLLEIEISGGHFRVVNRTNSGIREIIERKFEPNKSFEMKIGDFFKKENEFLDDDKKLIESFDFFLNKYNDSQKLAIVSQEKNILCVAGAGSGKTTVLTKRVEFLCKFCGVSQKDILAITFTKKAKEEMIKRLEENSISNVKVETFNSFCEKILKDKGDLIYDKKFRVISYSKKIELVQKAIRKSGTSLDYISQDYFNKRQLREKSKEELFFIFVNDVFSILDFYKNLEISINEFYNYETHSTKKRIAKTIYEICLNVDKTLKENGFRDFSDQVLNTLELFRKFPQEILKFKHVLVDEFQDVNHVQFELLKMLTPENIFAVGDPRQAIYGWRGSDVKFILTLPENFKNCKIINLKINYRSSKEIVDFSNLIIKPMGLIDLEANFEETKDKNILLVEHSQEVLEKQFVLESIKNSKNKRNEIFVLARTNRILEDYAEFFRKSNVQYVIKSEEEYRQVSEPSENQIILATVHSIKGLEANEVYIVSCNSLSFPNKVQDNFVLGLVKQDFDYDKEAEELRLFYVAISRAREKLVITYTGNYSKFIKTEVLEFLDHKTKNKSLFDFGSEKLNKGSGTVLKNMLKNWRLEKSTSLGLPAYMVLSNKTIDEISMYKPSSKSMLESINGLGPAKIGKYGDEILKIVNG